KDDSTKEDPAKDDSTKEDPAKDDSTKEDPAKDATQSNDNQGNGVANGDAQGNVNNGGNDDSATANSGEVNKDSKKESNKLPETGESNETTNNTLIGSILVALGTLLFGFRRNRKSE
ncbi:TPA: LPXTG cell wall anchor domain-containing protein, partial [Streptococcus agalactiae]